MRFDETLRNNQNCSAANNTVGPVKLTLRSNDDTVLFPYGYLNRSTTCTTKNVAVADGSYVAGVWYLIERPQSDTKNILLMMMKWNRVNLGVTTNEIRIVGFRLKLSVRRRCTGRLELIYLNDPKGVRNDLYISGRDNKSSLETCFLDYRM